MDNQNNQNNPNQNKKNDPKKNKQGWGIIIFTTLITALLVLMLYQFLQDSTSEEISYSKFLDMVDHGKVEKVIIDANKLIITPKDSANVKDTKDTKD
ncbi:MAG: ATP-dependent metallopeptidase FtsH/Yme1/Tma family protein, partial [Lachnospiraceae bacterium]